MAAAESNETRCIDVTRGEDATAGDEPVAVIARRQTECYQFRIVDMLYYAFSLSFLLADVATGCIVFVEYLSQGHLAWGCLAIGCTVLSACVTQLFSLRWYHSDGSLKTVHWLLHLLLLGFLHRYLILLYTAMLSLRSKLNFSKNKDWVYRHESDVCMLHLFESFMGAMPRLILQLYVIAILHYAPLWTSASAVASFCSLTWAVGTYARAMHNINRERNNATWIALVLQALWRSGTLLSRIGVLVLAAVFLRAWFLLFLGLHWLFMTIWVILQKTEFCPTVWEERIYNCIIGLIYCFDFFNLREGRSRYRVLAFYSVIATQNAVFLAVFAWRFADLIAIDTLIATAITVIGGMLVGLISMLLYYGKYHPSRMTTEVCRGNELGEHPATASADTPRSLKMFHRGSLVSLHHVVDAVSPRITSEKVAADKQSLLTNAISDCAEDGVVNRNYSMENEPAVRVSIECERLHSRAPKEEGTSASPNDKSTDNAIIADDATLSLLYQDLYDVDDAEAHHRRKRRGICLPITHGLDTEKKLLPEDAEACLSSRKRRGIYEHGVVASQLDWLFPNVSNIELNLDDGTERDDSPASLDSCGDVMGAARSKSKLATPTPRLEGGGRIFDVEKASKDQQQQQQRDETMSCVTSIHDYENVCPLGIARPPWCIRSWRGYTDIETYIHDDSVVRDRRRDTLTSTTGTTYSSEYSDGVFAASLISRGILKQDDYADTLIYDLAESKYGKSPYGGNNNSNNDTLSTSCIDDRNAVLYIAKPVVIDDRGGMLALDTIQEERDDSALSSLEEEEVEEKMKKKDGKKRKFPCMESVRVNSSASTLVSTIDQIRRYTAENSPRHVYHTTGSQWGDLRPKNPTTKRAHFAKVFGNDLGSTSIGFAPDPVTLDNSRFVDKREIDAIRELVKCCAIESTKKTPLIDAILSDSPILGSRDKLVRQDTFVDRKDDFDANESDLYVEMSPLVSVENSRAKPIVDSPKAPPETAEVSGKRNLPATTPKRSLELSDKENLAPSLSNKCRRPGNNNNDSDDSRAWTVERNDKNDRSLCNVRFNLKEKRHVFLEQVLSPPKLWNRRVSFHLSTKNL